MAGRSRWCRAMVAVSALTLTLVGCGSGDDAGSPSSPPGGSEAAFDAEEYFGGKTVQMIVTSSPGGNTDLFGRFVANKLSEQIPGRPRVAVTNEGGLGGIADVYEAPDEALVIGATARSSGIYGTADDPAAKQDPNNIQVIGGLAGEPRGWAVFGELTGMFENINDAVGSPVPFRLASTVGGPGEVESDVFLYSWLCTSLQLNCEYVNVADDSSSDINLMIERREVNLNGADRLTVMRDYLPRMRDGSGQLLFQYAQTEQNAQPLPEGIEAGDLRDELPENLRGEYDKILPLISSGLLGNMVWAGPAMPADAVDVLRDAYAAVMADPANVEQLTTLLSGDTTDFEYRSIPLSGQEAVDAYNSSNGVYQENKDFLQGLREQFVDLWN